MRRRFISIFSVVALVFALVESSFTAYAADMEDAQNEEMMVMDAVAIESVNQASEIVSASSTEKSQEEVEEYALSFMQGSQPEHDIKVLDMYPLYGMDDKLTGYYVLFLTDGEPNGYILISFLHEGCPVVELAFEGLGIFENLEESQLNTNQMPVRYIGPDEFYVESPQKAGAYTSLYNKQVITAEIAFEVYNNSLLSLHEKLNQPDVSVQSDVWGGISNWNEGSLDPNTIYKIPNFGQGGSYWTMSDFYAVNHCAPTAATNILWYWGWHATTNANNCVRNKVNSNFSRGQQAQQIFWRLHEAMDTNYAGEDSGTKRKNILNGYASFLGSTPGSGRVWNYKDLSGFLQVYNTITEQCPIHMSIYKNVNGEMEGHGMFALGRAQSTGQSKYVIVMDGSWRTGRLVRQYYYDSVKGYKIYVSL